MRIDTPLIHVHGKYYLDRDDFNWIVRRKKSKPGAKRPKFHNRYYGAKLDLALLAIINEAPEMGDTLDELISAISAARQRVEDLLSEWDRAGLERAESVTAG